MIMKIPATSKQNFTFDYDYAEIGQSLAIHANCFEWLEKLPDNCIHGIVTDPPYGVKEYDFDQLEKRANGNGGIWRIPPSFDGHKRQPLPRFTALDPKERHRLTRFFFEWSKLITRVLMPGGHVFIASNAYVSQLVFSSIVEGGLEFRGELIRLVRTLRGGDRPKNSEEEFPGVSSMARGCYEPWGIFRKPLEPKMTVSECLRLYQTGGLRRYLSGPFEDVIESERTPQKERKIVNHPSLKPQSLLRKLVYAILPLGEGIVADPFMGSGSLIAAAEAVGVRAIGIERFRDYYDLSLNAIPKLRDLEIKKADQSVDAENVRSNLFNLKL
jgi:site-specific DNA-methyltransferase (adenine-specific)